MAQPYLFSDYRYFSRALYISCLTDIRTNFTFRVHATCCVILFSHRACIIPHRTVISDQLSTTTHCNRFTCHMSDDYEEPQYHFSFSFISQRFPFPFAEQNVRRKGKKPSIIHWDWILFCVCAFAISISERVWLARIDRDKWFTFRVNSLIGCAAIWLRTLAAHIFRFPPSCITHLCLLRDRTNGEQSTIRDDGLTLPFGSYSISNFKFNSTDDNNERDENCDLCVSHKSKWMKMEMARRGNR